VKVCLNKRKILMKKISIIVLMAISIVANGQGTTEIEKQRLHQAVEMIKKGEPHLAQIELNQLIATSPLDEHLYLARAKCGLMLRQYDQAMNDYYMAARLGNRWLELDGRQGILYHNFLD
jgi:Tfp pilus assembly protein PilF